MGQAVKFKVDKREFTRTLNVYRQYSKRSNKQICDTKAFFIARRACNETYRTPKGQIEKELEIKVVSRRERNPSTGRMKRMKHALSAVAGAPLAALKINARAAKGGYKGFYGAAMDEAIKKLINIRNKSRAFLAASWLPAIRILERTADVKGAPRLNKGPEPIGPTLKGDATPASEGWFCRAVIRNMAETTRDHRQALIKYGTPALQKAFDAEEQSMRAYIEKKQREDADAAGIKHN